MTKDEMEVVHEALMQVYKSLNNLVKLTDELRIQQPGDGTIEGRLSLFGARVRIEWFNSPSFSKSTEAQMRKDSLFLHQRELLINLRELHGGLGKIPKD